MLYHVCMPYKLDVAWIKLPEAFCPGISTALINWDVKQLMHPRAATRSYLACAQMEWDFSGSAKQL